MQKLHVSRLGSYQYCEITTPTNNANNHLRTFCCSCIYQMSWILWTNLPKSTLMVLSDNIRLLLIILPKILWYIMKKSCTYFWWLDTFNFVVHVQTFRGFSKWNLSDWQFGSMLGWWSIFGMITKKTIPILEPFCYWNQ